MDVQFEAQLEQQLDAVKPQSILFIGPRVPATVVDYTHQNSRVQLRHIEAEKSQQTISPDERYDFALVVDTVEFMNRGDASLLISQLRDLSASLLWVHVQETDELQFGPEEAIAHGLVLRNPENFGGGARLYEFTLQSYKPVPKWLNAENWANPGRWNKARW